MLLRKNLQGPAKTASFPYKICWLVLSFASKGNSVSATSSIRPQSHSLPIKPKFGVENPYAVLEVNVHESFCQLYARKIELMPSHDSSLHPAFKIRCNIILLCTVEKYMKNAQDMHCRMGYFCLA